MIPGQLRGFIRRLTKATDNGEIKWTPERNALRPGQAFLTSNSGIEVGICKFWADEEERTYISFWVEPSAGPPAGFSVSNYDDEYIDMRSLYELASISAADISDATLDKFFGD